MRSTEQVVGLDFRITHLSSCSDIGQTGSRTVYNTTLLPSVNTLIARGMFCGAKYTHHTFTPITLIPLASITLTHPRSYALKTLKTSPPGLN